MALADGDTLLSETVLDTAGRRNARLLVPAIDELLKAASLAPGDIDVVAVSIGPGSFTGLRVGVVFAKTFAWLNDAQLVAVDTLQALAQRVASTPGKITVISDAQRGDVFVNTYQCNDSANAVLPLDGVRIQSLDSLLADYPSDQLLTGPGVSKFADQLPESIHRADDAMLEPRASALLPVAQLLIAEEQWADLDTLEPVYLRRSYAEEKRDADPAP